MILRDILPTSAYATIGTINNEDDYNKLEKFIEHNKDFVSNFKYIIIAQNGDEAASTVKLWRKYHPNCTIYTKFNKIESIFDIS